MCNQNIIYIWALCIWSYSEWEFFFLDSSTTQKPFLYSMQTDLVTTLIVGFTALAREYIIMYCTWRTRVECTVSLKTIWSPPQWNRYWDHSRNDSINRFWSFYTTAFSIILTLWLHYTIMTIKSSSGKRCVSLGSLHFTRRVWHIRRSGVTFRTTFS